MIMFAPLGLLVFILIALEPCAAAFMRYDILLPEERVARKCHNVENHYKFEKTKVIEQDHYNDQYVNLKISETEETPRDFNNGRITYFQCLNQTPRNVKISMHVIQGGIGTPELVVKVIYTPVQFSLRSMLNITCHIRTENMYDGTVGEMLLLNLSGVKEPNTLPGPAVLGTETKVAKKSNSCSCPTEPTSIVDIRAMTEASTGYTVEPDEASWYTGELVTSSSIDAASLEAHELTTHAESTSGELNIDMQGTNNKTKFGTTGSSLSRNSTNNNNTKSTSTPSTINLNSLTSEEPGKSIIRNGEVHMSTLKMMTTTTNEKMNGMHVKTTTEDATRGTWSDEIISSWGTSQPRPGKPESKFEYSNKTPGSERQLKTNTMKIDSPGTSQKPDKQSIHNEVGTPEEDVTTVLDDGTVSGVDETTCSDETCIINAMGEKMKVSTSTVTEPLISTSTVEMSLQKSQTSPPIDNAFPYTKISAANLKYKIIKAVTSPWYNLAIRAVPKDLKRKISLAKITY